MEATLNDLKELGFHSAALNLQTKLDLKKKLMIAYENYRFVPQEAIDRFNTALYKKTLKKEYKDKNGDYHYQTYDRLGFTEIQNYPECPPQHVIDRMKEAKAHGCFDSFEVAKVATVEVRPDPILFGRINDCNDRFFIDQWDNDVSIDQLIGSNEG